MENLKISNMGLELDDEDVFNELIINCLQEMYKLAQPSLDFKKYYNELKESGIPLQDMEYLMIYL